MAPKAAADAKAKAKPKPKPKAKADAPPKEESEWIQKPDREAMEAKIYAVTEKIDDLKKKKQAIEDKEKAGKGVKDEYFKKKKVIADKLGEIKQKIDDLHAEKDKYDQDVTKQKGEKSAMAQDVKKAVQSLGRYKSEEDINNRIFEIEHSLQVDTMPLKKEKELMKEMSELKKNRPKIAQVKSAKEALDSFEVGGNKETLKVIKENIKGWMEQKAEVLKERKELEDEYQGKLGEPKAYEDRKAINEKIAELIEEKNEIREAFKKEENKYWEDWKRRKQEQQEKYAAERKAKQAEWEERNRQRKAEQIDEQPFVAEITLVEQTIKFCKSLTSGKEEKQEEEKKEIDHSKNNMDGLQVLGKKDERDEFWFEPTKGKKNKGSKQKGEKGASAKPIKHSAQTFKLFDQLKLECPVTLDDIPQTLEKLEAQLEKFQQKVKDWEKTKEERKAKILAGGDVEDDKEDKAESKTESKEEEKKDEKEEEEKAEEKEGE